MGVFAVFDFRVHFLYNHLSYEVILVPVPNPTDFQFNWKGLYTSDELTGPPDSKINEQKTTLVRI